MKTFTAFITAFTFAFPQFPAQAGEISYTNELNGYAMTELYAALKSKNYALQLLEKSNFSKSEKQKISASINSEKDWLEVERLQGAYLVRWKKQNYTIKFTNAVNGELEVNGKSVKFDTSKPILPQINDLDRQTKPKKNAFRFSALPEANAEIVVAASLIWVIGGIVAGAIILPIANCLSNRGVLSFVGTAGKKAISESIGFWDCVFAAFDANSAERLTSLECSGSGTATFELGANNMKDVDKWVVNYDPSRKQIITISKKDRNNPDRELQNILFNEGTLATATDYTQNPPVTETAGVFHDPLGGQAKYARFKAIAELCQPGHEAQKAAVDEIIKKGKSKRTDEIEKETPASN
ncbi:MAG: hypothetical protein ABL958_18975 [Bdellovibrionia bacterium]